MARKPGGSNHLITGRARGALEHIEKLAAKHRASGMSKKAAMDKAYAEARDSSPRRDWRVKATKPRLPPN
jgi:outer membrane protein assembly factor BamD (BamD/ComL family)